MNPQENPLTKSPMIPNEDDILYIYIFIDNDIMIFPKILYFAFFIFLFFFLYIIFIDKFQNQYGQFDEAHIKRNNVLGAYIHCHKMVPIGVIVLCKNSQYKIRRLSIVII